MTFVTPLSMTGVSGVARAMTLHSIGHNQESPEMQAPRGAPDWAAALFTRFASGASGQFILCGNVHDQMPLGGRLVSIERYLQDELLAEFEVIFSYDLGNGLTVERGGERLAEWVPSAIRSLPHEPLEAIRFVNRYARYLGNLVALGRRDIVHVAVIVRGADQLIPADGKGFEHGSLTSLVREWGSGRLFTQLPFAEPVDRGQSQRPRAADRIRAALDTRACAAAIAC